MVRKSSLEAEIDVVKICKLSRQSMGLQEKVVEAIPTKFGIASKRV